MTVPKFDYVAPRTIKEAVTLFSQKNDGAHVMAGGTDLMVKVRYRVLMPKTIISLKKIKGINKITFTAEKGLTIGATALLADVASHKKIKRFFPTIAKAAGSTANVQVRNMGTVVGNLCNASPSADNAPTLLAMNAKVLIAGPDGNREMALDRFFLGPGITALEQGEIVTALFVPTPARYTGTAYHSLSQRGLMDCSAVCAGAMVTMEKETCKDARLFIGACAPIPMPAAKAAKLLIGKKLTDPLINEAAVVASKEATPISDVRASAKYRWKMVAVLTIKALIDARDMAMKQQS